MDRTTGKRGRGRPPRDPRTVRSVTTSVALTDAERARLQRLAAKAGVSIGQFIRARLPL